MAACSIGTCLPHFPAESACRMVAGSLYFNHHHRIILGELWRAVMSASSSNPSMSCTIQGLRASCACCRDVLPTTLVSSHIVMLFAHPQSLSSPEVISCLLSVPACARRIKSCCDISGNRLGYSHTIALAHVEVPCRFQHISFLVLQNLNALHVPSAQTPQTPLSCNGFCSQCLMVWRKTTLVSSLRNAPLFTCFPSTFATVQVSNIRYRGITILRYF